MIAGILSVVFAIAKLGAFARASPVDLDASRQVTSENNMAQSICHVCLKDRRVRGETGRRIFRTPVEITQDPIFNRKGVPARLCVHCDGGAYESAMQFHMYRTDGNEDDNGA